ncbi:MULTISPECIES: EboA domain-containing protein [unclassified Streptomyces]|uniref:EboA domain-containing protein n=1 Tax=unclassified Streptomyces TaxID=2593676 RepID=UPI002034ABD7|nr:MULTISPECIES: EboA domain-containing protein [unclassified Streptomyces]
MTHPRATPANRTADTEGPTAAEALADTEGRTPAEALADTAGPANAQARAGAAARPDAGDLAGAASEPDTHGAALARTTPADLRSHLAARLGAPARAWLHRALDEAAEHPGTHGPISVWELRIAEAGRRCGAEHADAARVLILHAARADADALSRVYFQGTAAERRAVLHALPHLVPGREALPLVEDALRTNDTRLLAAAVGPYAARHLDSHQWRHAVLKCLFTGVPIDTVADLARRAHRDTELARMLGDYAAERTAAGRSVPEDLHRVLTLTDPTATPPASAAECGTRGTDGKES